ncbi:formate/nitrite transporter family protein [Rhodoplanes sp. SY1]|uniref:formate/nitrite transporter family protein n=1 Tax=Rhodoplanes sp. SY1 TaxID=3166646 RepID=UPI0038B68DC0
MTRHESEDVEERSSPRAPVIYEVVRRHGEEEMVRPAVSLWWSGFAAGLSISFSLLAQALLTEHVPDAPWRPLVTSFGYSVGFLMVVLARQQLFTENTITIVLPLMARFGWRTVGRLVRVWGIVLAANLVGTLFAATFCTVTPVIDQDLRDAMLEISRHMMENDWPQMFFKGIASGFLIATMVWLIPSSGGSQFLVITLMTWLIALGEFTHIVAGSAEAFLLMLHGELEVWRMLTGFMLPVLLGNVVGGTVLFALIAYAQVMKELDY